MGFIDFLSGRMDYEHIIKSEADSQTIRSKKAQSKHGSEELLTQKPCFKAARVADHRRDTGFGGNNLEHLVEEERGRFDDIDMERTKKSDFTLLANFTTNL